MRNRTFLSVCILILVNQTGWGIITPVMPAYARSFGLGSGEIGLVIGIYGLARFVANVPAGQIAERRGRRTVLVAGTLITSLASALMVTAANLGQLLAYRMLAGLGAATVLTGGQIMVSDISTPQNRARMVSMYQGFFVLGVGLGPAPGGFLADHLGLRAPFVAYALFSLAACGAALLLIKETRPGTEMVYVPTAADAAAMVTPAAGSMWQLLRSGPFLLIGLVSFVQFVARTGAMFTVVPLLGKDRLDLTASQVGLALAIPNALNLAALYHAGTLADRLGRKWVIVPATLVCGLSMATFALGQSYGVYLLAAAIWGLGSGLAGPAPAAYVADLASAELRGRAFGLFRSVSDSGYIIGPLFLGWLAGASGYTTPLVLTGALFVLSALLFGRLAPETRQQAAPPLRQPLPRGAGEG
jgi:DHA1 family multidrug resistance protein-like MFS transporter